MKILETLAAHNFCRVADATQSTGNHVRLLKDGPEVFPAWLAAIESAHTSVCLENYILQDDQIGRQFAQALEAAAARGVATRVIYDWMGCLTRTRPAFWAQLRAAGVEVRRYNPPHLENPLRWISRDHRKVLTVDGRIAYTGGLCIGHDWMGDGDAGIPPWRDTAIEIVGPAVQDIEAAFADSWAAALHLPSQVPAAMPARAAPRSDGMEISVIAGHPNGMGLYRLEQLVAEVVERSLWLTDGYFVATTGYVRALTGAARAGVDVRLLVPGSSNWPLVGALSQIAYRPLLAAGVRVFEWNGPMLHAKTAVADGCWTRIGSSNSNLASWVSNRELDVTIQNEALAAQMGAMYETDLENATEVLMQDGRAGFRRTVTPKAARGSFPQTATSTRRRTTSVGRLVSGAIGFGSTLGASLSQHRTLGAGDAAPVLGGGLFVLAFGAVALFLPRLIAWPVAVLAIWLGLGTLVNALGLRRRQSGDGRRTQSGGG